TTAELAEGGEGKGLSLSQPREWLLFGCEAAVRYAVTRQPLRAPRPSARWYWSSAPRSSLPPAHRGSPYVPTLDHRRSPRRAAHGVRCTGARNLTRGQGVKQMSGFQLGNKT